MSARVRILGIDGFGEGSDRLDVAATEFAVSLRQFLGAFRDRFLQAAIQFLEFFVLLVRNPVEAFEFSAHLVMFERLA